MQCVISIGYGGLDGVGTAERFRRLVAYHYGFRYMFAVCSDTHGTDDPRLTGRTRGAVDAADLVIHAGDFTTTAVLDAFRNRIHDPSPSTGTPIPPPSGSAFLPPRRRTPASRSRSRIPNGAARPRSRCSAGSAALHSSSRVTPTVRRRTWHPVTPKPAPSVSFDRQRAT